MIPFAILSCQIERIGYENQEVRILDLSEEGFTFRLVQDFFLDENGIFRLHFFRFEESAWQEVTLRRYSLELVEEQEFYNLYRVTTEDEGFCRSAGNLMKEYMRYITLKLEEDDAGLSKELVGYPAELEEQYAADFTEQKRKWFAAENPKKLEESFSCPETYELAVALDQPACYQRYRKLPLKEFREEYWAYHQLSHHPLAKKKIDLLYIGNQFCHLLFPEEEVLFSILEKAECEQVTPVVVFTYMQESRMIFTEHILERLAKWCAARHRKLELVINDWGMLSMIREKKYECFLLTLGVLLQKHRKDVRMSYKQGSEKYGKLLEETAIHAPFYREYLREQFGITRISYEACGCPIQVAPEKASLHLPFYQMNTSQHCTLYARCHNGDRGRQSAVKNCPGYCQEQVFLYPEMLHMTGRYNSLFGYDETILKDGTILQSYLKQGIDRIVIGLL